MTDLLIGFMEITGAFISWMFKGFRSEFHKELKCTKRNMIVGAIFLLPLIALVILLANYLLSN